MKLSAMSEAIAITIAAIMLVAGTVASSASNRATLGAQTQTQAQSSNKVANPKPEAAESGTKGSRAAVTGPIAKPADPNVVACHALEVHTNAQPAVTILVFNQKNRGDHERLSDLLKDNEGASVEVKASDGTWHKASVARLRSCFGRGVLFFPGEASPVDEKDDFVLRFPAKKTS